MINDKSREELIGLIKKKLFSSSNDNFKSKVQKLMTQAGRFELSEYPKIVMGHRDLNNLEDYQLFWFANAMEQAGNEVEPKLYLCKTSDYFTPLEIKNAKFYENEKIDVDQLYTLHNVTKLANNQFSCTVSLEQSAEMKRRGITQATPDLQRESRRLNLGTEILKVLNIDAKKVLSISDKIVSNEYYFDEISFSLINDGNAEFIYDKENSLIHLPKDGDVIITDGNHRTIGNEMAYSNHPELKEMFKTNRFPVLFTYLPIDEIKNMISQKWKATPPIKKHKDSMERTYANKIVESIQIDPNAEDVYKGSNIGTTGFERSFIIQSELAEAIEKYYNVNSFNLKSQADKVKDWLVEFFNYLSELMIGDFKDYFTTRRTKWSTESKTWIGYVYLSRQLQSDPDWKAKLQTILNSIDWSRSNSPIARTNMDEKNVEKYFMKKWGDYFDSDVQ